MLGEFFRGIPAGGGVLGEFCTGWAAELGGWASFVSLRARRGLHRAFLAPIAPPIDPLLEGSGFFGPFVLRGLF